MTRIIIRPTGGISTVPQIDFEASVRIGPSVRDTKPVQDAQRLAKVAQHMKEFGIDRHDSEQLQDAIELMDGSDWQRRQGEQS